MSDFEPERLDKLMRDSGVSFRESGQSYILDCPRCGKKDKLYIRRRDGRFVCWHCAGEGFQGRPEYALTEILGQPLADIRRQLYRWTPDRATVGRLDLAALGFKPEDDEGEEILTEPPLPEADLPPETWALDDDFYAKKGRAYVEGRGVPLDVAMHYGIRYWTSKRCIVFPIVMNGRCVGYQTRTTQSTEPYVVTLDDGRQKVIKPLKAMTSDKLARDRILMFHDRLQGSDHAVLCEGPFDAIKAHLCGGNVATLGKWVSDRQLDLIVDRGIRRIYLGLDPDAIDDVARLIRQRGLEETYLIEVPKPYKDLGEMPMEAVLDCFHDARRVYSTMVFVNFR
jgi:hypothetical protein